MTWIHNTVDVVRVETTVIINCYFKLLKFGGYLFIPQYIRL